MKMFSCLFKNKKKSAYFGGFYYHHIFLLSTKYFASIIASTVDLKPQKPIEIIKIHRMMLLRYSINREGAFGLFANLHM